MKEPSSVPSRISAFKGIIAMLLSIILAFSISGIGQIDAWASEAEQPPESIDSVNEESSSSDQEPSSSGLSEFDVDSESSAPNVSEVPGSAKAANTSSVAIKTSGLVATTGASATQKPMSLSKASISSGTYTIKSNYNSKRIKLKSAKTSNGSKVVVGNKSKSVTQKWYISKVPGTGSYRIQSVKSGRFLSVSGNDVVENRYSGDSAQIWNAGSSAKAIVFVNKMNGKALTVTHGTALTTEDLEHSSAQRFKLSSANILSSGVYYIQPKSSKKVLGVTGALTHVGSSVKVVRKSTSASNKWIAVINKDGTYTFRNANSARVLSVKGSARKGANVYQGALSSSKTRKWKLALNKDGGINIVSAKNGKSFIGSSSLAVGSNSKIVKNGNAKAASFTFKKTRKSSVRSRMERKIRKFSSRTQWLIAANTNSCFVGIYKGKKGHWTPYAYFPCTSGAYSSPSKKGVYRIGSKGYAFGSSSYTCYYFSQYSGNYLFHSVLYNAGTFRIQDGRMGIHASHGCIRLELVNAKWIYKNIPSGTTVYVY